MLFPLKSIKRARYKVYTGLDKESFKTFNETNAKMREKKAEHPATEIISQK